MGYLDDLRALIAEADGTRPPGKGLADSRIRQTPPNTDLADRPPDHLADLADKADGMEMEKKWVIKTSLCQKNTVEPPTRGPAPPQTHEYVPDPSAKSAKSAKTPESSKDPSPLNPWPELYGVVYEVRKMSAWELLDFNAAQHINPAYLAGQLGVTQAELVELVRTRWSGRPVSRDLHAGTDDAKVGCTGTGGPVELRRSITHNWHAEVHLARTTGMSVGWDDPRYR